MSVKRGLLTSKKDREIINVWKQSA